MERFSQEELERRIKHFNETGLMLSYVIDPNIDLVMDELARAEAKHSWEGNDIVKNALILSEEAGEVSRAVLRYVDEGASIEEVKLELIQTAAMCFRMLKNLPE